MRHAFKLAAVALAFATTAGAGEFSGFYGTWVLPGDSCDENTPPESIMVVAQDRLDFLEVGCTYKTPSVEVPADVAPDAYFISLTCSGIDSGPWDAALFLQLKPGDRVLQAFEGFAEGNQTLQRCAN